MGFSPLMCLIGGVLMGAAASVMALLSGHVLNAGGLFAGCVKPDASWQWRWTVVVGMGLAGLLNSLLNGHNAFPTPLDYSSYYYSVGGLLVGFGSSLAGGCTSAHILCGLPQLSKRSMGAIVIFWPCAMLTTLVQRHVALGEKFHWGTEILDEPSPRTYWFSLVVAIACLVSLAAVSLPYWRKAGGEPGAASLVIGFTYGCGMGIANLTSNRKVVSFLDIGAKWDVSVGMTYAVAALTTAVVHQILLLGCCAWVQPNRADRPLTEFSVLASTHAIDTDLVAGSVLFGIGWGLAGVDPSAMMTGLLPYMYRGCEGPLYAIFVLWSAIGVYCHHGYRLYRQSGGATEYTMNPMLQTT